MRKLLTLAAAFAAVAAAAAVCVVAASFAIYALVRDGLGPAGGAAVVAGLFALVAVIVAVMATRKTSSHDRHGLKPGDSTAMERVFALARERPLMALGVAATGAMVLMRNPAVVTALVSAFFAGKKTRSRR